MTSRSVKACSPRSRNWTGAIHIHLINPPTTGGSTTEGARTPNLIALLERRVLPHRLDDHQEYRGIFEKDHALTRRFQKIIVDRSAGNDRDPARLRPRFEEHHGIQYEDDALIAAAELSARHINDRHLPDKAIDVIDEAGSRLRLKPEAEREPAVSVAHIEDVVARIARIPPKTVSSSDRDVLRTWSATSSS